MKRYLAAAALVFALAACETTGISSPSAPSAPAAIPSAPLELGDWRSASESATLQAFQQNVEGRYSEGLAISAVSADLRRSEFNCGAAPPQDQGRGDPPAQVCRKTATASGCTHTWQVHLFEANGALSRTRGLYDRRCGGDGLLGGPGSA
jgi:hypothetical protein